MSTKASPPDGFPAEVYKHFWITVLYHQHSATSWTTAAEKNVDFWPFADTNHLLFFIYWKFFTNLPSGIGFEKSYISTRASAAAKLLKNFQKKKGSVSFCWGTSVKLLHTKQCLCSCVIQHCGIIHILEVFYRANKWSTKAVALLMYSVFASKVVIFITESLRFTANIGKSIKFMNDSTDYSFPGLLTSKTDSSHT